MLEGWAIKNKRLKKWLYSILIERSNLRRAACLHALTKSEVADYRRYGLRNPVALIPNGVDVPPVVSPDIFLERFPHLRGKRLIIFLSRIHYKKGLDVLCRAWLNVHQRFTDAHLIIAGPDFENTQSVVQAYIDELRVNSSVTFTGMLRDSMKWSALAASELFVLPSYSEGFSVAVLEAMVMGVPVVISRACNFNEVEDECCGVVISPDAQELQKALTGLLSANRSDVLRMGERGRRLVVARYTWAAIGRQMSSIYTWLLGGPEPANVPVFL
jgi:glycosyltransferase involved in cell wall biosynthesis